MNLEGRLGKWSKAIRDTIKKRKLKKKGLQGVHRIKHIGDTGRGGETHGLP